MTDPAVPTGMNTGVSIVPRSVLRTPQRACAVLVSMCDGEGQGHELKRVIIAQCACSLWAQGRGEFPRLPAWPPPESPSRSSRKIPVGRSPAAEAAPRKSPAVTLCFPAANVGHNQVHRIEYESSHRRAVLELERPIWIYSRRDLDGFLLEQAIASGAELVRERALHIERRPDQGWSVRGDGGTVRNGDFLAGADGTTSSVRKRMGLGFRPEDLSATLGYYVPRSQPADSINIRFQDPDLFGYLWSFPRMDHVSLGLITVYKRLSSFQMRQLLDRYLFDLFGPQDTSRLTGYSAPVPTLREQSLRELRVSGDQWALVGDAAGFTDPITAEGIWYAIRSADLLADCLVNGRLSEYSQAWRDDFGQELIQAAHHRDRFYAGRFLGRSFIDRMLQLTGRSATFRKIQGDLIAGELATAA